jgi:CheY-like chemotaxis protein
MAAALRILLVDDDPILIDAYRRTLSAARPEWRLWTATTGRDAMRLMEQQAVDALVTDLEMPGVDGIDLLHWVRHYLPAVARIVVSGVLDGRTLIETRELAHIHLVKPFPADALVEHIEHARLVRPLVIHIVDDSDHDRRVIRRHLAVKLPGAVFEVFADGAEFLDRLARDPVRPDLVVLDVEMPAMNGLQVLRSLRESGDKVFPVVVFSSEGVAIELRECETLGADACLQKPSTYAEYGMLVDVVGGLLRHRRPE